ncbi:guanyl-nucleotide exchange factor [Schizosaccharomyces cryophilus OY26]|uniref:Guanyl-nucleotide exchange factor n=1 Tax=Schizosaccharomyces cryophilus (strain OY26 / ATCC MYA-4695 / CBS 11777 / NBRC 106824 / NRRL Y48691) TaxID=653667 RepID=S9W0K1_SCHCR|nr:guanyl-nucleotide exchange factor [Schizosaccharomyces cryophilus OY26]EPY51944.1 guanyl-nucleotide exchange factor [Schizosaccharomyces cryophilus OY26]
MNLYETLISFLQSISLDSRKKNADLKNDAESSIKLLEKIKTNSDHELALVLKQDALFFRPFLSTLERKLDRYIIPGLNSVQSLVIHGALSPSILSELFPVLDNISSLGQDVQLRILQILPIVCIKYAEYMQLSLLVSVLHTCFSLHNNRNVIVSNAASATLRQVVILVFDHLDHETSAQRINNVLFSDLLTIFSDLCALISSGNSELLKVNGISETFGLELIESILVNHHHLFERTEFQDSVRKDLLPIITASLASMSNFSVALRVARILSILFQHHTASLSIDVEVILSFIISSLENSEAPWKKALFLEVLRCLFTNSELIFIMYSLFDGVEGRKPIISKLITSLNRIINENPSMIGVGSRVLLPDFIDDYPSGFSSTLTFEMEKIIGTFTGSKPEQVIGICRATILKTPCIEQFDKQDPPIIPAAYLVYLAMCSLVSLCKSTAEFVMDFHKTTSNTEFLSLLHSLQSNEDIKLYPDTYPKLKCYYGLISQNWTAFLVSYSTFMSCALSTELLKFSVNSYVKFICVCTIFRLETPRDALLTTLSNKAVPSILLTGNLPNNNSNSVSNNGRLSTSTMFSVEGLKEAATTIAGMATYDGHDDKQKTFSLRELIFLRSLSFVAQEVGELLGKGWKIFLETVDKADIILNRSPSSKHLSTSSLSRLGSSHSVGHEGKAISGLMDQEMISYKSELSELMLATSKYDDQPFMEFLESLLAVLTSSCIDQTNNLTVPQLPEERTSISSRGSSARLAANRSISGGIRLLRKSSEVFYSFTILEVISSCNLDRLSNTKHVNDIWPLISSSLSDIFKNSTVSQELRIRAAKCLANILVEFCSCISNERTDENKKSQEQFLQSVSLLEPSTEISDTTSKNVEYDISSIGLEALALILETVGHNLFQGWRYVFDMLRFSCAKCSDLFGQDKGAKIVRLAFSCLQLICTDFLGSLDMDNYLDLLDTLLVFCRQEKDANVSLTAVGLFWIVSDTLKNMFSKSDCSCTYTSLEELYLFTTTKRREILPEVLWIMLLVHLADLCENSWASVRDGAAQILFRIFNSQCSNLGINAWASCCQLVILKILSSQTKLAKLALNSDAHDEDAEQTSALIISGIANVFSANMDMLLKVEGILNVVKETFNFMRNFHNGKYQRICMSNFKAMRELAFHSSQYKQKSLIFNELVELEFENWISFCELSLVNPVIAGLPQEGLKLLVECLLYLLKAYRFEEDRLCLAITRIRKVIFYEASPSYALDIDFLSSLQEATYALLDCLIEDYKQEGLVVDIWADILFYAFNEEKLSRNSLPTFICFSKKILEQVNRITEDKILPMLRNGVMSHFFNSLLVPMKLKYRCPRPSRINEKQAPIWTIASSVFVDLTTNCFVELERKDALEENGQLEALFDFSVKAMRSVVFPDINYESVWSLENTYEKEDVNCIKVLHSLWKPYLHSSSLCSQIREYFTVMCKGSVQYQMRGTEPMVICSNEIEIQKETGYSYFPSTETPIANCRPQVAELCYSILLEECQSSIEQVRQEVLLILQSRICWSLKRYMADRLVSGLLPLADCQKEDIDKITECISSKPVLFSSSVRSLLRRAYYTMNATSVSSNMSLKIGGLTLENEDWTGI